MLGTATSCYRKKDTFLSRNWNAVTTEYNTLYNGNLALEQGRQELNQNYQDNYWDLLPIERLQIEEQITLPDSVKNQNFGYAEEKAVKAIQKHSMLIKGKERNPQIDEAYLLLGKARYFDQRFIPALEAFNYVLHKYPTSSNINQAQIWREKTHIRLDNNRLAIKNLKKIIKVERLTDQARANANAALAQAYINLNAQDSAIAPLKNAAKFTTKNQEKGRYLFIEGQLYNNLKQTDSANLAFDEVIALNRRSPRVYMINAYIQKTRNFDYSNGDLLALKEVLQNLENNRENRPFLDKIYFQIGEFYSRQDSIQRAVEYYNKSLRSPSSDKYLKSINYEILANINFNASKYRLAAKYFDSTLAFMSPRLKEFRSIKKKRNNLEDIILYEGIVEKNDSILKLANLPRQQQIAYFTTYTNTLKEKFTAKNIEENPGFAVVQNNAGPPVPNAATAPGGPANAFYFYNPNRIAKGAREFLIQWGNRPLADNWRQGTDFSATTEAQEGQLSQISIENDPKYDPQTYVSQLPSNPLVLDSLQNQLNYANYQLGVVYNENFGEYVMAVQKLEKVLENNPQERLVLPSKYNLYTLYGKTGQLAKQQAFKTEILEQYPKSRYAAYIRNPQQRAFDEYSPEKRYNKLYKQYEIGHFKEVLKKCENFISNNAGEEMLPKFELLKAQCIGRLHGLEAYQKALNEVALSYPQTPEGKKAQQLYNKVIPQLQKDQFVPPNEESSFKMLYRFQYEEEKKALQLKEIIDKAIKDLDYGKLYTSRDVYSPEQLFIVVHGLKSKQRAQGFAELLQINKEYKITYQPVIVSSQNYRIIQIHKNLAIYEQQFEGSTEDKTENP